MPDICLDEGYEDDDDFPNTFPYTWIKYVDMGFRFTHYPHKLVVYVDGSCRGNGTSWAYAGVGVFWGNRDDAASRSLGERLPNEPQTNNGAELYAIIRAIETCRLRHTPLEIRTDSQYAIKCVTEWIYKWRRNGFTNCRGLPVANQRLIKHLMTAIDFLPGRVTFSRGHRGSYGSKKATALAYVGADRQSCERYRWYDYDYDSDSDK